MDYLDVNLNIALETNGEQLLLPISFMRSLSTSEWQKFMESGPTADQCAEIWRLHRREGPPPKTMKLLIRFRALEKAFHKVMEREGIPRRR